MRLGEILDLPTYEHLVFIDRDLKLHKIDYVDFDTQRVYVCTDNSRDHIIYTFEHFAESFNVIATTTLTL